MKRSEFQMDHQILLDKIDYEKISIIDGEKSILKNTCFKRLIHQISELTEETNCRQYACFIFKATQIN